MTELLEHLHPAYRAQALASDDDRIASIRADRWVHYARAEKALSRLEDLLTYPPRDRMPCLLMFGRSGMGKTQIVRKFKRHHPPVFNEKSGSTTMPVVAFQMPPEPIDSDFFEELLREINAPAPHGGSVRSLRDLCRRLLAMVGARMLIIDEVNSMLAGTYRQQRLFLNTLRFLANDLRIPMVCVGTEEAKQGLLTDPQLADRFEAFELPPWQDGDAFRTLLATFASILPLRRASNLDEPRVRKHIIDLTDGVTVRICRLIEVAAIAAIRSGEEAMELASFRDQELAAPLASLADSIRPSGRRRAFT